MTFTDDKTHYVWIYILKHKDEVFPCFLEWKTLVEKSLNQKVKALRTDNGGGFKSVRTVIALAVQNGLKLHQMDVATDLLNGELKEEVYMKQPDGFVTNGQDHLVCRLKRSIYSWKQSSRCWNVVLDKRLKKMALCRQTANHAFICLHVGDIVLATKTDKRLAEAKRSLSEGFEDKDMGEQHHYLGGKVIQNPQPGELWIGQEAYARRVLQKFGMENAKPIDRPVNGSSKLVKTTKDCEGVNQAQFQSAVRSLLYLSIMIRPDITYAVNLQCGHVLCQPLQTTLDCLLNKLCAT